MKNKTLWLLAATFAAVPIAALFKILHWRYADGFLLTVLIIQAGAVVTFLYSSFRKKPAKLF